MTEATTAATPWHQGADAEMLGFWQNKVSEADRADPVKTALATTKMAIEAQKFVGVPPAQLLRLPTDANDEAGWKAVYARLGAPSDPKDYDFSTVKHADGSAPPQSLLDAARSTAAALRVAKDKAPELAAALVKHLDAAKAEADAGRAQTLAEQKARLDASWGTKKDINYLTAVQGAKRLGISPDAVTALEQQIGYDGVMEAMRKIGAGTTEDTFVEGGNGGAPATIESAQQRLAELQSDPAWGKRLTSGDLATRREWQQLTQQIAGVAA